ncbi:uncharacterized protein C8Q71DRAFT_447374 [Rhodofomes roseus]|uniref:Uncharacterized protein n=1 Tax=Rhodofomes roseus TaxID=34475 RepID=A0ABQ8JYT3_9APHY|nr:uncharacterized protein C8Q71DRAFT_447374 [Rhodofomes roseus]KAH9829198.1 hypothetical protein C8Q71DRAFT_447374 [Rhodofomes roseus]
MSTTRGSLRSRRSPGSFQTSRASYQKNSKHCYRSLSRLVRGCVHLSRDDRYLTDVHAKKIYNWYNNLNSQQNRKDTELYSRKYYKDRIQPLVETELGEREVSKVERIEVIKRRTREAYDAEDAEVKAEIQEEIRALRASRAERGTSEGEGTEEVTDEHVINAIASQAYVSQACECMC